MHLVIGSDHAGFGLKTELADRLREAGHTLTDVGAYTDERTSYTIYAHKVAEMVQAGLADYGVLICGSGQGVCMTANRHRGVRAALVYDAEVASLVREHNDANVICLPARTITTDQGLAWVERFIGTAFEGGRHKERVKAIDRSIE